jgi:cyanate permease
VAGMVSIPASVFVSNTSLMRFQLCVATLGALTMLFLGQHSFGATCLATGLIGYGIGCTFGLAMTLANDYKYTL